MTDTPENSTETRWDVLTVFVGTALVALTVAPVYGWLYGYSNTLWVLFIAFMLWNGLSITAGYHRLWSHKSYQARLPVRILFALGGALALQNSIRTWCSNHRRHHQFVDDPERDPYAASRGLWYSHIGWMLKDDPAARVDASNVKDLDQDWVVRFQDRHYWTLSLSTNVLLTLAIGYAVGDALGGLLLLGFVRLFLCHHTTFFINSLAHYWGSRPYSENSSARDNGLIALLTYGEGYHNFHHTFQWDYRNGLRWYQYDPTKWLIRTLAWTGLAANLKRTPPEQIERSMVAMQLQRAKAAAARIPVFKGLETEIWLERLDTEYNELLERLNQWSIYRQEWVALKKQNLADQANELRARIHELESELKLQRERWQQLHLQFVQFA